MGARGSHRRSYLHLGTRFLSSGERGGGPTRVPTIRSRSLSVRLGGRVPIGVPECRSFSGDKVPKCKFREVKGVYLHLGTKTPLQFQGVGFQNNTST